MNWWMHKMMDGRMDKWTEDWPNIYKHNFAWIVRVAPKNRRRIIKFKNPEYIDTTRRTIHINSEP